MNVADATTLVLLIAAVVVAGSGGYHGQPLGIRISVRSADRVLVLAAAVALLRHWRYRRPAIWDRFVSILDRAPRWTGINAPGARDEVALFPGAGDTWPGRAREFAVVALFYLALAVLLTFPQGVRLDSVPDFGDPLFSIWRLAWVAHQLVRDPLHLFDANIFYPERLTLTYSDAMIAPGLAAAPFLWAGAHPVYVYNVLLLASFVLSGTCLFALVRALTGRRGAALVAGAVFAFYPYRFEHYSHLELQLTFWMPLVLLALHRVFARGEWRHGLAAGVLMAGQALSSMYYGAFLSVFLVPIAGVLLVRSPVRWRAIGRLSAGACVAAALVAPFAAPYVANRGVVGDRDPGTVLYYSATPQDYLEPHSTSPYFDALASPPRHPERELFPTMTPVALTLVGVWPPLSAPRIGYLLAGLVSFDASLGMNGRLYPPLREYLPPFRGLRVPARFSVLVGLALSILAGYGAARIIGAPGARRGPVLALVLIAVGAAEVKPQLQFRRVWVEPPSIYATLAGVEGAVLADFPLPPPGRPDDARGTYFSVFHWRRIVSGISGHFPLSYIQLLAHVQTFPDDPAIDYLKEHGVTHIAVHGWFYRDPQRFARIVRRLDRRRDLALVATAPFRDTESRLYRFQDRR